MDLQIILVTSCNYLLTNVTQSAIIITSKECDVKFGGIVNGKTWNCNNP